MVKESDFVSALGLKRVLETDAKMLPIEVSNVNRPGLQFANYWDFFAYERPQLLPNREHLIDELGYRAENVAGLPEN